MTDCIFCKIASGEIPAKKIYEDQKFLAILDVNPRAIGHCLIIPKKHATTLTDLPKEDAGPIFQIVQHLAKTITERLGAKGYNIGSNNGEAAGQAVPHLHLHIIPRYDTDKHKAGFEAAFQVNEDAKKDIDKTLNTITRGKPLPPIKTTSSSQTPKPASSTKEEKEDPDKKSEPKWRFNNADNIMDDIIEH